MIIIAEKYGGLCNRLLMFAHFIGWGIEHGITIANPAFDEFAAYFEGTADDPWCRYPSHPSTWWNVARARHRNYHLVRLASQIGNQLKIRTPWIGFVDIGWTEPYALAQQEHIRALSSRKLMFLTGWQYRDEPSPLKHVRAIRIHFTPRHVHLQRIDEFESRIRTTCDVLIGVHIRRGDFRNFRGGIFYYENDVYLELMSKIRQLFKDREVGFLICSNEPLESAAFTKFNAHFGPNHFIEDLYLLARCDYLIAPPSSYSAWASYYGDVPLLQILDPPHDPSLADFVVSKLASDHPSKGQKHSGLSERQLARWRD